MQTRLFNRNFIIIIAITFCSGLTAQLMNTALPLYIVNALGGSTSISGVLSSIYTLVACVIRPISGIWVDRIGRKRFITIGMILFAVGCFGFGTVALPFALILFRIIQGVGFGISSTASGVAATDNIPPARLGEGLGYVGMCNSLPMVIGPSIALALIAALNYTSPFFFAGLLCVIALLLSFAVTERFSAGSSGNEQKGKKQNEKFRLSSIFEKKALPSAGIQIFLSFAASCWMVYGSLYAQYRGYGNVSVFFVVSALGMVLSRLMISKIVDHANPYTLVIPTCLLWTLSFVLILLVDSSVMFLAVGVIYGVCLGISETILNMLCYRGVPAERRGAANATYMIAFDGGIGLGGLLLGFIIDAAGGNYDVMILAGIFCTAAAAVLSLLLWLKEGRTRAEA